MLTLRDSNYKKNPDHTHKTQDVTFDDIRL